MNLQRSPLLLRVAASGFFLIACLAGCASGSTKATASVATEPVAQDTTAETAPPTVGSPSETSAPASSNLDLSKDYGDGITLATSCRDFIQEHDSSARYDAAIRMSSDFAVDSPGNPMWGMNMDSVCGGNPGITLGDYFGQAGSR